MGKFSKEQVRACYYAYLSRPGPSNLGTVEWPKAKPGCLSGMKFLTTGVLETITREDAVELLRQCGGHVMSGMSKNLNYLIVGRDAGPRKLEDAEEWGITQLSEEEFFNFIKERIDSYDPSQNNGVEEKPKKKTVKKELGKKSAPKEEPKSPKRKESKKKAKTVKEEVGERPEVVDTKPKASRGRAAIEIDMTEEEDGTKSIKSEAGGNGRAKKRTRAGESSASKQVAVKDEPVSDVEEPSTIETKAVSKKKSVKELIVKTERSEEEPVKPKRGRSKKLDSRLIHSSTGTEYSGLFLS